VLVSGSADYSMPAHALWAYRAEAAPLQLVVVDRCETPLALSRWYAEPTKAAIHGTTLSTQRADILDHEGAEPVDVIFTNSFLGSFAPEQRPRLAAAWRRLLRPGGRLVFTNRLRPGAPAGPLGFDAAQARSSRPRGAKRPRAATRSAWTPRRPRAARAPTPSDTGRSPSARRTRSPSCSAPGDSRWTGWR
jgi:SAM-dependent methyltransferase